jgi:2-desacetyl-2-hydroxyethyl bacteriochlorophyllide A dehydrogenase
MMTPTTSSTEGHAVWFTAARQVELRSEPVPAPGDRGLVVRAVASLVSAGTEMNVYRGEVATADELALPTAAGTFPFPMKFAYQVVGNVVEAGPASGYAVGDRVFAYHPHQDVFQVTARPGDGDDLMAGATMVFPVPASLPPDSAAFANLFCVAYNALLDVPVRIGDVAVVYGLGVIGSLAASLARLTAGRLVLVDPLPERRRRASWIGADAVTDPASASDVVRELSAGRGADVAIEASGATEALQGAIDATGAEGTIAVISYYGRRVASLRLSPEFHLRRQRIVSSMVGVVGSGLQPRWDARRRMEVAMERLADIDVQHLVTHRIPFEQAPMAYALIDTQPQDTLGVVLRYGQ